jgi:hypothetical protein
MILDVRQQNHVSAKAAGRRPPLIDCFAIRWPDGECMHSPSGDCPLPGKALKVREKKCLNYRLFQDLPLLLEDAVLVAPAVIISHQIMVGASRHHFFENAFTHLFSVESPTPRSAETCRHPLSSMLRVDCRTMVQSARCAPHPF